MLAACSKNTRLAFLFLYGKRFNNSLTDFLSFWRLLYFFKFYGAELKILGLLFEKMYQLNSGVKFKAYISAKELVCSQVTSRRSFKKIMKFSIPYSSSESSIYVIGNIQTA